MRIFFIDFENVHSEGMTGVDHLTDADEVVIFYSNNADSITFDVLHKLMFCKSKLSYYKIKRGGKNALDFQLSCYLGFRINKNPDAEFYIISKDSGYDFIMDFWEQGYCGFEPIIRRFNNIRTLLQWQEAQRKQKAQATKALEKLVVESAVGRDAPGTPTDKPEPPENGAPEATRPTIDEPPTFTPTTEQAEIAAELMANAGKSHELYLNMVKRFGQKKGRELYSFYKAGFAAELRKRKEEK
ncbi:MAG: PIN domain-containing protein [Oscillospiraceae bacterium]|nr:PIN domain-containing protein [Oscillospiraceae bacterium]